MYRQQFYNKIPKQQTPDTRADSSANLSREQTVVMGRAPTPAPWTQGHMHIPETSKPDAKASWHQSEESIALHPGDEGYDEEFDNPNLDTSHNEMWKKERVTTPSKTKSQPPQIKKTESVDVRFFNIAAIHDMKDNYFAAKAKPAGTDEKQPGLTSTQTVVFGKRSGPG